MEWIGLCDLNKDLGNKLAKDIKADYFTTDMSELLRRPEVNAAMILTDENCHTEPTLLAIEHNHKIFVEKPLATDMSESLSIINALKENKVDACVGYTQRFRRRFLANISPMNINSQRFFKERGFKLIQYTYEYVGENL